VSGRSLIVRASGLYKGFESVFKKVIFENVLKFKFSAHSVLVFSKFLIGFAWFKEVQEGHHDTQNNDIQHNYSQN
jgi:hypothetical protein